jgi:hypothetical protein
MVICSTPKADEDFTEGSGELAHPDYPERKMGYNFGVF